MALQTGGECIVAVDRPTAFAFVRDPQRLARCIPGCQDLVEISPTKYSAVLASRVGIVAVSFKVVIDVVKIDEPRAIDAKITGDAIGQAGRVAATASLELLEPGARQTLIRYQTDINLTGRLGGIGQPVFRATSQQLAREFASNLKSGIEGEPGAIPAPQPVNLLRKLLMALWRLLRGRGSEA